MSGRDTEPAQLTRGDLRKLLEGAEAAHGAFAEAMELSALRDELRDLRDELDELGRAHDAFVAWVFEIYDWFLLGMPEGDYRPEVPDQLQLSIGARERLDRERLDRFASMYNQAREPDGAGPTQARLAELLDVTDRWIRRVGWNRIVARADELLTGGTPG